MVPLDRLGRIDGDLIVRRVAVLDAEVKVLELDVEVRQDQFVFDKLPNDPRHLIAVQLDDRVRYLNLLHALKEKLRIES